MKKRIIAGVLLLTLITFNFSACGGDSGSRSNVQNIPDAGQDEITVEEKEQELQEPNLGYDFAFSIKSSTYLTVYYLVDFDRQIMTQMNVHSSKSGDKKTVDRISTYYICGSIDDGWYTNSGNETHAYYSYEPKDASQNDNGLDQVIKYNWEQKPCDSGYVRPVEHTIELLHKGFGSRSQEEINKLLQPED